MTPLIATLLKAGLGILGNAVLAKGKDVIEDRLGIRLPADQADLTPDQVASLKAAEMQHEEFLIAATTERLRIDLEAEKAAQGAVTQRWQADMLSDSWLSKNIRPLVLLYLLGSYTVLSLLSAFGINVTQAYVELLAQAMMLVLGAYFVGRSIEKGIDMRERGKL
jgi:hypothetical protein